MGPDLPPLRVPCAAHALTQAQRSSLCRDASGLNLSHCLSLLLSHHAEFVLLVTPHVSVTHEIQGVVVGASGQGHGKSSFTWREQAQLQGPLRYLPPLAAAGGQADTLTLAFCCRVSLLMEMRLLDLASPITTHQPSSRFCSDQNPTRSVCKPDGCDTRQEVTKTETKRASFQNFYRTKRQLDTGF